MKNKWKNILATVLLLAVVICTCPLPTPVRFDGNGSRIKTTADTPASSEEHAQVEIKGWYYRFLFFQDFMKLKVRVEDAQGGYDFHLKTGKPILYEQDGIQFGSVYTSYMEGESIKQVYLTGTEPWKDVVLEIKGVQEGVIFAASESEQSSLQTLLEESKRLDIFEIWE